MTLANGEFELRGMKFGTDASGYPLAPGGFAVGETSWRVQDEPLVLGDGTVFGVDELDGITYSWDLQVYSEAGTKWVDVAAKLDAFRQTWLGETRQTRRTPGAVEVLRLHHGLGIGRIYGRPRRHAEQRAQIRHGDARIICDFKAVDDLIYSDETYEHVIDIVAASTGGLTAPLTSPLKGAGVTDRNSFVTIGGSAPTWPVIRFNGPVTNPTLELVGGWVVGLNATLLYDQYVVIDPRPWRRSVLRNNSASMRGSLTGTTPALPDLQIDPGTHEFIYRGTDITGSSSAVVSWNSARYSA